MITIRSVFLIIIGITELSSYSTASGAEASLRVSSDYNDTAFVGGAIEGSNVSCVSLLPGESEFLLDLDNQTVWLVQHRSRRKAEISSASLEDWRMSQIHLRTQANAVFTEAFRQPELPSELRQSLLRARNAPMGHNASFKLPESKSSTGAQTFAQFVELDAKLGSLRSQILTRDPESAVYPEVFSCLFNLERIPFTVQSDRRSPAERTFQVNLIHPAIRDSSGYTQVPLNELISTLGTPTKSSERP